MFWRFLKYLLMYLLGLLTPFISISILPSVAKAIPLLTTSPSGSTFLTVFWATMMILSLIAFSASFILNGFLMGFSNQKSLIKFLVLTTQGLPMIVLLWIALSAPDTSNATIVESVGGGAEYYAPAILLFLVLVGSYWGMQNPFRHRFFNK
ncbi:MAG: hypothetical protein AB7P76_08245 [Candidatus Melainabacteria bacterium]